MTAPVLDRTRIVPDSRGTGPRGLMVLLSDAEDVVTRLVAAAERARSEQRPMLVGLVEPPRPLTIDAAIQARYERRRADDRRALVAAALACCRGVPEVGFVKVAQPRALTAERARHGLRRRAQRIAMRRSCVLVPA